MVAVSATLIAALLGGSQVPVDGELGAVRSWAWTGSC